MSDSSDQSVALVPAKLLVAILAVGLLSFFAFFALLAYAPDFREKNDAGAHALSKSAVGFAALRIFLADAGLSTAVDNGRLHKFTSPALAVLTPDADTPDSELYALDHPEPRLIILPKWIPVGNPLHRGRVVRAGLFDAHLISALLKSFSAGSFLTRERGNEPPELRTARPSVDIEAPNKLQRIDSLQTLHGPDWVPVIVSERGGVVLARLKYSHTYVLSDPDFMNTHGLRDLPTAGLALSIIRSIRVGTGPIGFDVTLNGFRRAPNLLRDIFAPPFLGATVCAIIAALLLALHAANRFGSPIRTARIFALGKEALVENTAQLIRMMHREPQMAARYAAVMRNVVLQAAGSRRDTHDARHVIAALERTGGTTYDELLVQAREARSRLDLMKSADDLFRWRQRMTHGT